MLLLLPIIYYEAKRIILDFVADFVELYRRAGGLKMQDRKRETADALQNVGGTRPRKRRAITHTFIIIALSGTVCKGKKSSAKRVFTGSYGILTNRP